MAQRLLSIPWIYWSVVRAMILSFLGIMFWVIFDSLTGVSNSASQKSEPVYEGGMWWLLYAVAATVLTVVLDRAGAPGWMVEILIAVSVLGVLPLYWKFQWKAPPVQTPDVSGLASVMLADPSVDAAEMLRPSAEEREARDPKSIPARGSSRH